MEDVLLGLTPSIRRYNLNFSLIYVVEITEPFISVFKILIDKTEPININLDSSYMFLTVPACFFTLLLNICVLMIIWKKEKTRVNQLMMMGCMVNIIYSPLGLVQYSSLYRGLGLEVYCSPHLMLSFSSLVLNRLLPVAIGMFRYDYFKNGVDPFRCCT